MTIQTEADTKTRVEQELRKLVDDERKRTDEAD